MKKISLLAFASLFILGLAMHRYAWAGQATWPPEYRAKVTMKVYQADYDKVFAAVVNTCENNGYPVVIQNKENGIIATDAISGGPVPLAKLKLNFTLAKIDEDNTRARLYIHYDYPVSNGYRNMENYIDEDDYRKLFEAIGNELNKSDKSEGPSYNY